MKFTLGQKVKVIANPSRGTGGGKANIYLAQFANNTNGQIVYNIRFENGANVQVLESDLKELKTQTLYAFVAADEEVHWATKNYSRKELSEFGFTPAPEFNKTIDLE